MLVSFGDFCVPLSLLTMMGLSVGVTHGGMLFPTFGRAEFAARKQPAAQRTSIIDVNWLQVDEAYLRELLRYLLSDAYAELDCP